MKNKQFNRDKWWREQEKKEAKYQYFTWYDHRCGDILEILHCDNLYDAIELNIYCGILICGYKNNKNINSNKNVKFICFRCISKREGIPDYKLKYGTKYQIIFGDPIKMEAMFSGFYECKKALDRNKSRWWLIFVMKDETIIALDRNIVNVEKEIK